MTVLAELESITRGLGAVSSLTEGRFLEIGEKLETSIGILGALNETFEHLHQQLESENVRQATSAIRHAASRVVDLGQAHVAEKDAVGRIGTLTTGIGHGVSSIAGAVKNADLLAISARIAAANLGDTGSDFSEFASEIARTLKLAQGTLDRFRQELAETVRHLAAARAGQTALDRDQSDSMRAIPARLSHSIDAIAEGSRRAADAAAVVREKSREVSQRIANAVAALQIGDKTRQRIEHAEFGLNMLRDILADESDAADGEWAALDRSQRLELVSLGCRLQAAQMAEAAAEFDSEVLQTLSALSELAEKARDILQLGKTTYGGNESRGAFLLELKDDVSQARALLEAFSAARSGIDGIITAVSQSGATLFQHIGTVRSLEADIRIMGLNATLKCGRLGQRGRALGVVAHELRIYANQIHLEAATVTADLEKVVAASQSLSDRSGAHGRDEISAIAKGMSDSVRRLGAAGESLAAALAALQRDGAGVAAMLEDAVQRMSVREEIGRALARAAADLAALGSGQSSSKREVGAPQRRMLDMLARTYTMVEERIVHDKVVRDFYPQAVDLPRVGDAQPAAAANADAVDSMLF